VKKESRETRVERGEAKGRPETGDRKREERRDES